MTSLMVITVTTSYVETVETMSYAVTTVLTVCTAMRVMISSMVILV